MFNYYHLIDYFLNTLLHPISASITVIYFVILYFVTVFLKRKKKLLM